MDCPSSSTAASPGTPKVSNREKGLTPLEVRPSRLSEFVAHLHLDDGGRTCLWPTLVL